MPNEALTLPRSLLDTKLGFIAAELCEGTEADPTAVLMHLLAGVGGAVGPNAYSDWAGRRTPARLFVLVIGATGAGKGYAESLARPLLEHAAPDWTDDGIVSGLVSGEGLLAALGGEREEDDDGPVTGRSLLVIEPEFGRVLEAGRRDGSTLTHLLRALWDHDHAASLSRARPLRVKGAHLSVIGHITPRELRTKGDIQTIENGFLNRFIPVRVRPGSPLPFGPERLDRQRDQHAKHLAQVVAHAGRTGCVPLAADARSRWAGIYYRLHGERPGVVGALSARATAHVQRLALLFALGDLADAVSATHLHAAQELWTAAEATWRDVYGDTTGDKLADRMLEAIRGAGDQGIARGALRAACGSNNVPADRIAAGLRLISEAGLADARQRDTGGRPAEIWVAARPGAAHNLLAHNSHNAQAQRDVSAKVTE